MDEQPSQILTIALAPDQARRIQHAVEAGGYASESEVVHEAIRLWAVREDARTAEAAELKRAYEEGLASGEGRPIQALQLLSELKAEARGRG